MKVNKFGRIVNNKRCVVCGVVIPEERIELLPNTSTCVRHSVERPLTEDDACLDGADSSDLVRVVRNAT